MFIFNPFRRKLVMLNLLIDCHIFALKQVLRVWSYINTASHLPSWMIAIIVIHQMHWNQKRLFKFWRECIIIFSQPFIHLFQLTLSDKNQIKAQSLQDKTKWYSGYSLEFAYRRKRNLHDVWCIWFARIDIICFSMFFSLADSAKI